MKHRKHAGRPPGRITILGGGAAGLAAGYYAASAGLDFTVLEAEESAGGMCRTRSCGDFRFDLGAHRFHDQDSRLTQEMKDLLGERLPVIEIGSQIYSEGRLIDFPLSPFNLIRNIGPLGAMNAGLHLISARLGGRGRDADNFERFAVHKYGRPIAKRFLLNYSEKLWGLPCGRLSLDVSGKRLKGLSLTTFLLEAFTSGRIKTRHLDGAFYYPEGGFGGIIDGLTGFIGPGRIRTDSRVTRVLHREGRVTAVELNGRETVETDRVISTLPLPLFISMMDPACPPQIASLAASLSYRSLILVMLMIDRESVTRSGTVYFPDPEFPFNRVSEPRNRSGRMSPAGKTSLLAEIPCGGKGAACPDDEAGAVRSVVDSLARIGWIREADVIGKRVERLEHAYPILETGHAVKVGRILKYLESFRNLRLIGRNSLFKYTHFHNMMRQGQAVIEEGFKAR
ncbi:MAG: FAD-dependent oxidoreductase [bacterium]|nr:FAD-dependent oxidoreductase [bacterium]